jgi:hypothetical protein
MKSVLFSKAKDIFRSVPSSKGLLIACNPIGSFPSNPHGIDMAG